MTCSTISVGQEGPCFADRLVLEQADKFVCCAFGKGASNSRDSSFCNVVERERESLFFASTRVTEKKKNDYTYSIIALLHTIQ